MKRVVISGFYGFDNAGDEAILKSMICEFRKNYSDVSIVVLSANPEKTAKDYNVYAVDRSNLFKVYSAIKNSDALVSGGGSLFQDATSVISMWYYSSIIIMAFFLKKPVFAFAQGIGPIVNVFNKKLLRYLMKRVTNISVRDVRSLNELRKLGIERSVSSTIDPAFLIEAVSNNKSLSILKKESSLKNLDKPRVGFSVRKWKGDVDVVSIMAKVADMVHSELGADVVFFPLHYKKDVNVADEIAHQMKNKPIIIKGSYSSEEIIGLYGLMDLNVCIRFHGLVFSIVNCIPTVPISYDPKIDSLMEQMDMKVNLKYHTMTEDTVFEEICKTWNKREELKDYLCNKNKDFKKLASEGINELTKWFGI